MNAGAFAAVGFDGYIDRLVRVVRSSEDGTSFRTIADFAAHVGDMAGLSGDMELIELSRRYGGNAPLIAGAIATLGMPCVLAGAIEAPAFDALPGTIRRIALGPPADALALEFEDGKVMLADVSAMRDITRHPRLSTQAWESSMDCFREAALCVLVNWSAMPEMAQLWEACLNEIATRAEKPLVYLDIADPSKRSKAAVEELAALIPRRTPPHTCVGVNEKELYLLCEKLGMRAEDSIEQVADALCRRLERSVVVHGIGYALATEGARCIRRSCRVVAQPRLTTGGGDHFSAGWCYARLNGLGVPEALDFASAVSGAFVEDGVSPDLSRVANYMA